MVLYFADSLFCRLVHYKNLLTITINFPQPSTSTETQYSRNFTLAANLKYYIIYNIKMTTSVTAIYLVTAGGKTLDFSDYIILRVRSVSITIELQNHRTCRKAWFRRPVFTGGEIGHPCIDPVHGPWAFNHSLCFQHGPCSWARDTYVEPMTIKGTLARNLTTCFLVRSHTLYFYQTFSNTLYQANSHVF